MLNNVIAWVIENIGKNRWEDIKRNYPKDEDALIELIRWWIECEKTINDIQEIIK